MLLNCRFRVLKSPDDLREFGEPHKLVFVVERAKIAFHDKEVVLALDCLRQVDSEVRSATMYEEVAVPVQTPEPGWILTCRFKNLSDRQPNRLTWQLPSGVFVETLEKEAHELATGVDFKHKCIEVNQQLAREIRRQVENVAITFRREFVVRLPF